MATQTTHRVTEMSDSINELKAEIKVLQDRNTKLESFVKTVERSNSIVSVGLRDALEDITRSFNPPSWDALNSSARDFCNLTIK